MYPAFLDELRLVEVVLFFLFAACGAGGSWLLWLAPANGLAPRSRRRLAMLAVGCVLSFAALLTLVWLRVRAA